MNDAKETPFIFNLMLNPGTDQKKEEQMIAWASEHLSEGLRVTEIYKTKIPSELWEEGLIIDAISLDKDENSIHMTKESIIILPIYAEEQKHFLDGVIHVAKCFKTFLELFGKNSGYCPADYFTALFDDVLFKKIKTEETRIEIAA